jgi:hypothetical protein
MSSETPERFYVSTKCDKKYPKTVTAFYIFLNAEHRVILTNHRILL